MSETCQRCGSVGSDRRTLWMACFYQMGELGLPFEQAAILGRYRPRTGTLTLEFIRDAPVWGDPEGEERHFGFYTLRVCKRCRADWMSAIKAWFEATPKGEDHDADEPDTSAFSTGIFVRDNGAIREISREEWDRRNPGQEPVTFTV